MQGLFNTYKLLNSIHCTSRLKDKHHINISLVTEKLLKKIQHDFMTETVNVIYNMLIDNINLYGEKFK